MFLLLDRDDSPALLDSAGRPVLARGITGMSIRQIDQFFKREKTTGAVWKKSPWVYSAIDLVARSVATIPFGLWTDTGTVDRDRMRALTRPVRQGSRRIEGSVVERLLRRPNRRMAGEELLQQICVSILASGNAYLLLDRSATKGNPPQVIEPLLPGEVKPVRSKSSSREVSAWQVNGVEIEPERIVHLRLPSLKDPILGDPPHESMENDIEAEDARAKFDANFYSNAAIPPTVLTHKRGPLSQFQKEQLRQELDEKYSGPAAAGRTMILGGDFDFKTVAISQAQAQFRDIRMMFREMVAAIYHVPVGLLSATEASGLSRAGLEVARSMLYDHAVIPLAFLVASKITTDLVEPVMSGAVFAFDLDQLPVMRQDLDLKSQIYRRLVEVGVPVNEAIALLDLDIDPVPGGNIPLVPANLVPLGAEAPVAEAPKAEPGRARNLSDDLDELARGGLGLGDLARVAVQAAASLPGGWEVEVEAILRRSRGARGSEAVEAAVWCYNAIRYLQGKATRVERGKWCGRAMHLGRYPGDSRLPIEVVKGCVCVLAEPCEVAPDAGTFE